MPDFRIAHATGSYPVTIQAGVLDELADRVAALWPGRPVAVITDDMVAALLAERLADGPWALVLSVPAGESSKSRARWEALTDALFSAGLTRDAAIVALGGGMIGDLAGFVAATYARGIPFLQVPTTLLAMVDASVGGKTGVDTPLGKNLVGAFHPPAAVLADPLVLQSLPPQHLRCGLAEMAKHGLIADAGYLARSRRARDGAAGAGTGGAHPVHRAQRGDQGGRGDGGRAGGRPAGDAERRAHGGPRGRARLRVYACRTATPSRWASWPRRTWPSRSASP